MRPFQSHIINICFKIVILLEDTNAGERLDEQRWPNLAALISRIKARPSMQALLQDEQAMLASLK